MDTTGLELLTIWHHPGWDVILREILKYLCGRDIMRLKKCLDRNDIPHRIDETQFWKTYLRIHPKGMLSFKVCNFLKPPTSLLMPRECIQAIINEELQHNLVWIIPQEQRIMDWETNMNPILRRMAQTVENVQLTSEPVRAVQVSLRAEQWIMAFLYVRKNPMWRSEL